MIQLESSQHVIRAYVGLGGLEYGREWKDFKVRVQVVDRL